MKRFTLPADYYTIYHSVEREVLELSTYVYFSDDQLNVYSTKIADLILRCVTEIEAIANDIYRNENGTNPDHVSTSIKWINAQWNLENKRVKIYAPEFHFCEAFSPCFAPFLYVNDSVDDYVSAYNAIKHDRIKNRGKASVSILIRALAALYILIQYSANTDLIIEKKKARSGGEALDKSFGSDIFELFVLPSEDMIVVDDLTDIKTEWCVYRIERRESLYAFEIIYRNSFEEQESINAVMYNRGFQEVVKSLMAQGKILTADEFYELLRLSEEMRNSILDRIKINEILRVKPIKMEATYHVVLNKELP